MKAEEGLWWLIDSSSVIFMLVVKMLYLPFL